jgi:hypothetical protein
MNSIAYEYAPIITDEIFIAEGVFQQNRPKPAVQMTVERLLRDWPL